MIVKMKALIGFSKMKDDELLVTARTIVNAMTDNANFLEPTPSLTEVEEQVDDFDVKLAAARKRGSPEDTALKNESFSLLVSVLQKLGYYVNTVADGHLPVLLSSGFPTNAPAVASVIPPPVEGVRLSDGRQSGQMRLDFMSQRRVLIYEYCYRQVQSPEDEWSERYFTTSSRGNILAPLEPGTHYEARVRAVNIKGAGDWSQTVSMMVR